MPSGAIRRVGRIVRKLGGRGADRLAGTHQGHELHGVALGVPE